MFTFLFTFLFSWNVAGDLKFKFKFGFEIEFNKVNRNGMSATKSVWHEILLRHMIFEPLDLSDTKDLKNFEGQT